MQLVVKIYLEITRRIKQLFTPQVSFLDVNSLRLAGFICFCLGDWEPLASENVPSKSVSLPPGQKGVFKLRGSRSKTWPVHPFHPFACCLKHGLQTIFWWSKAGEAVDCQSMALSENRLTQNLTVDHHLPDMFGQTHVHGCGWSRKIEYGLQVAAVWDLFTAGWLFWGVLLAVWSVRKKKLPNPFMAYPPTSKALRATGQEAVRTLLEHLVIDVPSTSIRFSRKTWWLSSVYLRFPSFTPTEIASAVAKSSFWCQEFSTMPVSAWCRIL